MTCGMTWLSGVPIFGRDLTERLAARRRSRPPGVSPGEAALKRRESSR